MRTTGVVPAKYWLGLVGLICAAAAGLWAWRGVGAGRSRSAAASFEYDLSAYSETDPHQLVCTEVAQFSTGMNAPRGVATGPGDRLHVVGRELHTVIGPDGREQARFALEVPANCIAVAADGTVYVGVRDHVETYDANGARTASWPPVNEHSFISSIAVAADDVFVADAGNRVVLRYDRTGQLRNRIGDKDSTCNVAGLIVPSPFLDVALAPNATVWVVNPGRLRVERYTYQGTCVSHWGQASMEVAGFCGCCNPVHLAVLPDGSLVTSEKGIPRVKLYDAEGRFVGLVAGAESFQDRALGLDLTTDSAGRIVVLDPVTATLRIHVRR